MNQQRGILWDALTANVRTLERRANIFGFSYHIQTTTQVLIPIVHSVTMYLVERATSAHVEY